MTRSATETARPPASVEAERAIASSDLATHYRDEAIRLTLEGRFAESEAVSREAIALRPDDVDVLNALGVAICARAGLPRPSRSIAAPVRSSPTISGS